MMNDQSLKKVTCPKCKVGLLRRLSRVGFVERNVLYSLKIFPWECVLCREKSYLRNNGHAEIVQRGDQKVARENQ